MPGNDVTDYTGLPPWAEKLAEAGGKFDGHVTNGSLREQIEVVQMVALELVGQAIEAVQERLEEIREELE